MSPLAVARAVNVGRLAIGAAMLVAPEQTMRAWVGDDVSRPATQMLIRSFGFREVVLGGIGAHVAHQEGVGPRTIRTLAACDAVDVATTFGARAALPGAALPMMVAVAGGAAVAGTFAARGLARG